MKIRPAKGSHLVLRAARLGHPTAALTVAVPGESSRYVFVLPQPDGLAYLGLTDEPHTGDVPDAAKVTEAEQSFLLDVAGSVLDRPLQPADVVGRFAGFRPLLDAPGRSADLSRQHVVHEAADGLLTVTGGKLTTYRAMAQDAVDRISDRRCMTPRLPLVGAGVVASGGGVPQRLVRRFGTEAGAVAALADAEHSLLEPIADGLPVLGVELLWAVRQEGALTVEDLLDRRTRLGLVPADAALARPFAEAVLSY